MQEGPHQAGHGAEQPQQGGQGDQSVHDGEEPSGPLQFEAGGQFERSLQGTVALAEPPVDHANDRVLRALAQAGRPLKVAVFQGREDFLHQGRVAFAALAPPPEGALSHDGHGDEGANQDGPHDGAAFDEEINNNICQHKLCIRVRLKMGFAVHLLSR